MTPSFETRDSRGKSAAFGVAGRLIPTARDAADCMLTLAAGHERAVIACASRDFSSSTAISQVGTLSLSIVSANGDAGERHRRWPHRDKAERAPIAARRHRDGADAESLVGTGAGPAD